MKKETMITPRQFAEQMGVAYTTVMSWLQQGLVKGALKQETPHGHYWEIPISVAENFNRPALGRPKKVQKKTAKPAK